MKINKKSQSLLDWLNTVIGDKPRYKYIKLNMISELCELESSTLYSFVNRKQGIDKHVDKITSVMSLHFGYFE